MKCILGHFIQASGKNPEKMCKSPPKTKKKKIKKTQLKNLGIFNLEGKPPVLYRASLGDIA